MIDPTIITKGMPVRLRGYDDICHIVSGWRFSEGQGRSGGMYTIAWPDGVQTRHSTDQLEAVETAAALR